MARKPTKTDRLSRELARSVIAFGQFFKEARWTSARVIAAVMEDDDEPFFIVAERREAYSQGSLLRGLRSLAIHSLIVTQESEVPPALKLELDEITGGTEILGRLGQEPQWLHKETGGTTRRESSVPFVIATDPVVGFRRPRKSEQRRFLAVMRAFTAAMAEGDLRPTAATHLERTPTLVISGDAYAPSWKLEYRSFSLPEVPEVASWTFSTPERSHWKRVDASVNRIIARAAIASRCRHEVPLSFFFHKECEYYFSGPDREVALASYVEWFARDWEWAEDKPCTLELILEEYELVDDERALIESRLERGASIYRIDAILDEETIRVADLYSDETHEVVDRALARTAVVDHAIPLRLLEAGPFFFACTLAPQLTPMMLDRAMQLIRDLSEFPAPDCFEIDPNIFGAFFDIHDHLIEFPPALCNTDGDPLVLQRAHAPILDEERLRQGLDSHPDLEWIEEDETWAWFKAAEASGARTLRGQMSIDANESLIIEVNSYERLQQARDWLEEIGGIGEIEVKLIDLADDLESPSNLRKIEDQEEVLIQDPQVQGLLRETLDKQMMGWLDEQIPALGMKTPREVVQSEEGREKVKTLIRSMGNPSPMMDYEVPRAAMFHELGLD